MAENKTLTSAPGPSEIAKLSSPTKAPAPKLTAAQQAAANKAKRAELAKKIEIAKKKAETSKAAVKEVKAIEAKVTTEALNAAAAKAFGETATANAVAEAQKIVDDADVDVKAAQAAVAEAKTEAEVQAANAALEAANANKDAATAVLDAAETVGVTAEADFLADKVKNTVDSADDNKDVVDKYETDEQGILTKNGIVFTGEYLGKQYKDGKEVKAPGEPPKDETEPDSIRAKLGLGEALLQSKWAKGTGTKGSADYIPGLQDVFDLWKQKKYTAAEDMLAKTAWGKLGKTSQQRELGKLEGSQEYATQLKAFVDKMRGVLLRNNLPVDEKKLEDYFLSGTGEDVIVSEVYNQTATGAGTTLGPNERNLRLLQIAAKKNNLDLNAEFGNEVDSWLRNIFNGQGIETFYQRIRDRAAEKTDNNYVKNLLLDGSNLRDVYDRYLTVMADKFKISKDQIDLNDKLLSQVFKSGTGMNLVEFENLTNSDARYKGAGGAGESNVKGLRQGIVDYALSEGFELNDDAVEDLLNNILAMGLSTDSPYVKSLIRAKFTYSPGVKLGGVSGNRLNALRQTAARNGLDLDAQFGSQIETWLKRLSQGEDIETFNRVIRQAASFGRPETVRSLMGLGVDLETILSPYKNTIASELGINPETIMANDTLLNKAFGDKGELSLGDYRKIVRQDPRFGYSDKAYQETYNAGLKILQDFGFQG